jgi:putative membrane protein
MEQYVDTNVLLAFHIIFMVTWFSGLFYIVRLFVYHREADEEDEFSQRVLKQQFKVMQKRLWYGIAWPSMVLTAFFGIWLLIRKPFLLGEPWMHLKLGLVFFLILYHILNHLLFIQAQQDRIGYSGFKLRIWNEVATLFLVSIVFIVFLGGRGGGVSWKWGALGILIFALALYLSILLYKKLRNKNKGNGPNDRDHDEEAIAKRE